MTKRFAILTVICFLSICGYVTSVMAINGYTYYIPVTITNSNDTQYSGRLLAEINADNLTENEYIQSSGEDIQLTNGSTIQDITAGNLNGSAATWILDYQTVGPNATTVRNIWTGNPDAIRDQVWISSSTDTMTVLDDPSLDITTDLTVEGDFYCTSNNIPVLPYGELLASKTGNYRLVNYSFLGNNMTAFVVFTEASTGNSGTPSVNADGPTLELNPITGSHYTRINDSNDATYVYTASTSYLLDLYDINELDDVDWFSDINSISLFWRYRTNQVAVSAYTKPVIKIGSTSTIGSEKSDSSGSWVNESQTLTRPSSGTWSWDDLQNINFGIYAKSGSASYQCQISEVGLSINYDSLNAYYTYTSMANNAWRNVRGNYDGSAVELYIDDILAYSATLSGSLNTNDTQLSIAQFNGYADNIYIGDTDTDTPVKVAEYTFEPTEISGTTIEDVTSNTNTITYSLDANPAGITVTVGKLTPYLVAAYSGGATSDTNGGGIPVHMDDEPSGFYGDDDEYTGLPGSSFINSLLDETDIPRGVFWNLIFLAIAIGFTTLIYDRTRDIIGIIIVALGVLILQAAMHMGVGIVDILLVLVFYIALYGRRETKTGGL